MCYHVRTTELWLLVCHSAFMQSREKELVSSQAGARRSWLTAMNILPHDESTDDTGFWMEQVLWGVCCSSYHLECSLQALTAFNTPMGVFCSLQIACEKNLNRMMQTLVNTER